jgi:cytoskeleton protein RodZ
LPTSEPAASASAAELAAALPAAVPAPAASAASAGVVHGPLVPVPGKTLQVRASAPTWVEVQDANSRVLVSRLLQPGEALALDGQAPLKLKVGNAEATEVMFRGQALDLAPSTRDNVARLVLR